MAWLGAAALLATALPLVVGAKTLVQVGEGQCNGGVGGSGEHYCLLGGTCNEGGQPVRPPTQAGTGCPGTKEYLLCQEDTSINETSCRAACEADSACVGFLITEHAAKGAGRCELHTKVVEYAAAALECYTYSASTAAFTLIGRGACRTRALTAGGPQNGTHYGNMAVRWVADFAQCRQACQTSSTPCVGVEYHRTAIASGDFKCEVHFEELSASEMSIFKCFAQPTCRNLHTCTSGILQAAAAGTACARNGEGGHPNCGDSLCCRRTATDISSAGPGRSIRLALAAALGWIGTSFLAI